MTIVVGDTRELTASFLATWVHRAQTQVQASPEAHVAELVRVALAGKILRPVDGQVSDGFHTFVELYRHRMLLNAALFGAWEQLSDEGIQEMYAHKSLLHSDGEVPFGGGWFIVVAQLPTGQISYHYPLDHWDLFRIPEKPTAALWDGHTADQAADRLQEWLEA